MVSRVRQAAVPRLEPGEARREAAEGPAYAKSVTIATKPGWLQPCDALERLLSLPCDTSACELILVALSLYASCLHFAGILLCRLKMCLYCVRHVFSRAERYYHSAAGKEEICALFTFFQRASDSVFLHLQKLFSHFIL